MVLYKIPCFEVGEHTNFKVVLFLFFRYCEIKKRTLHLKICLELLDHRQFWSRSLKFLTWLILMFSVHLENEIVKFSDHRMISHAYYFIIDMFIHSRWSLQI